MKSLKLIWAAIITMLISSCGKFRDGTSIYAEGGWVIPAIPAIGALIGWGMYIAGRNSGAVIADKNKTSPTYGKWIKSDGKALPEWPLYVGIFCTLITVAIIVAMNWDK